MENTFFINYGDDIKRMTVELLNAANVYTHIPSGARVSLKPNLAVSSAAVTGATTHIEIVEGVIEYLRDHNFSDIEIIEGSWYGDDTQTAFKNCGYLGLSQKYNVPLYDLKRDETVSVTRYGETIRVCQRALNADYLINLPVMKAHCETTITCAIKNMKGCIPDSEKRRFHASDLHKLIAVLGRVIRQDLIIADAICPDLTYEGGGNPAPMGMLALCHDPLWMDIVAAVTLGADFEKISYINHYRDFVLADETAKPSLSDESITAELQTIFLAEPTPGKFRLSGEAQRLSRHIIENGACSPCYGALIRALHHLKTTGKLTPSLRVHIGQRNKGNMIDGVGVGNCCAGCNTFVKGCPPSATAIIHSLST